MLNLKYRIMLPFRDFASEKLNYARFYANHTFVLKWSKNANYAQNSAINSTRSQSLGVMVRP